LIPFLLSSKFLKLSNKFFLLSENLFHISHSPNRTQKVFAQARWILNYDATHRPGDNEYGVRVAHSLEDDKQVIEASFECVIERDIFEIFRKRK